MKRIAIVGCGGIAKVHGLAIQDLGFECAAVTDIRPEAAQSFARNYPELRADFLTATEWMTVPARKQLREMFKEPRIYPDLQAMKDAEPLDAVIIATLPGSHCELTCQAAAIGAKAVLCEKPMAMSMAQCRTMIDACTSHNARLAVYNEDVALFRFIAEARHAIACGRIGKVEFVHATTVGTLMNLSVYLWAAIRHLLPSRTIVTVDAAMDLTKRTVSRFQHIEEDRATVHFTMNDGTHGVMFTGQQGFAPVGVRVDGSEGSVQVSLNNFPNLRIWTAGSRNWEVVTPPRDCMYSERRDFLGGIANEDPFFNGFDGTSGMYCMAPVYAAWQSHFERRPVKLDEPPSFEVPATFPP